MPRLVTDLGLVRDEGLIEQICEPTPAQQQPFAHQGLRVRYIMAIRHDDAVGAAVARARAGHGPQLVVAKLLRLCGHGEHDDSNYVDARLKNSPLGRDCLTVAGELLISKKIMDAATLATWRSQIIHEIEDAVATAQREPAPDPFTEDWRALSSENLVETHAST